MRAPVACLISSRAMPPCPISSGTCFCCMVTLAVKEVSLRKVWSEKISSRAPSAPCLPPRMTTSSADCGRRAGFSVSLDVSALECSSVPFLAVRGNDIWTL